MAEKSSQFYITTGTGTPTIISTTSSTAASTVQVWGASRENAAQLADIEKAVYAHIQAVRTLGRSHVNTAEIAQALSLPQAYVIAAIQKLKNKGIRVAA